MIAALLVVAAGCDAHGPDRAASRQTQTTEVALTDASSVEIVWDDADSGRINGKPFRIANIDAPELEKRALCDREREAGLAAKMWAERLTSDARLVVTREYGPDDMTQPRQLIDLQVDGRDYGLAGLDAGVLRPWRNSGATPGDDKPNWCRST